MIPLKDNVPTGQFPFLTVALIAINIIAFGWQLTLSGDEATSPALAQAGVSERDQASIEYGAIPFRITHPGSSCGVERSGIACGEEGRVEAGGPEGGALPDNLGEPPWWVTIVTSMFLHVGLLHIAVNMLFLWVFGNNIEAAMGRARFLAFYLLAGTVAVYAQAALDPAATTPTVGASGAVAGVLGAYALLHPRARVLSLVVIVFFVTLIEVPAMVLLGIWFLLQLIPAVGQFGTPDVGEGGGVAYLAHIGGFLFGLAAIKLFARSRRASGPRLPVP